MHVKKILFAVMCCFVCIGACFCQTQKKLPEDCSFIPTTDGQMAQKNFLKEHNLTGKISTLYFNYSCSSKNKGTGACVDNWKDINVLSHAQAIILAQEYGRIRKHVDLVCSAGYVMCGRSFKPRIACNTVDGKNPHEFVFNSIQETNDYKWKKGLGTAQCRIFLGSDVNVQRMRQWSGADFDTITGNVFNGDQNKASYDVGMACNKPDTKDKKDLYTKVCSNMDKSLQTFFGYSASYHPDEGCRVVFGAADKYGQREYCDADINDFGDLQVKFDEQLIVLLGGYMQRKLNKPVTFSCKRAFKTCKTAKTDDPVDDVLECSVDGKSVSFIFDDLSESKKVQKEAGTAAMVCMQNGQFDGRRCQGITMEQCNCMNGEGSLNGKKCEKIPGGTKWNEKMQACVMLAARTEDNLNKAKEVAMALGISAALVVATVETGGMTAPVLMSNIAGLTAGAVSVGITYYNQSEYAEFTSALSQCKNRACVKQRLSEFLDTIQKREYSVTEKQVEALDEIMSGKIEILAKEDKNGFIAEIQKQRQTKSTLENVHKAIDVAGFLCNFLPLVSKSAKVILQGKAFAKMPKTLNAIEKASSGMDKVNKVIGAASLR